MMRLRIGLLLVVGTGGVIAATFHAAYAPLLYGDSRRGSGEDWTGDPEPSEASADPTEAPAGFDGLTNGAIAQGEFDDARKEFEEQEEVAGGLGPVYNAQSCAECHQNPLTGGISQVTELRAGHRLYRGGARNRQEKGRFEPAPGGSLVNDRAIHPAIQERVADSEDVRSLRTSLNTLGDGFVEAISDHTLLRIAREQAYRTGGRIHGEPVWVPVLEADNALRIGRFGWKDQHASLLSFSADAYLNEMGITNPLQPVENTSLGRPVEAYDQAGDPEDEGDDTEAFAAFMRATKAPPRDEALAATAEAVAGAAAFEDIGCAICHVTAIVTAPAGSRINRGTFVVPPALGNKVIHPFSDFLLHDVGTGDGIVQNGGEGTANKLRTPPLWGVRTRTRLMHDGQSLTFREAILRHGGEAEQVTARFRRLDERRERDLIKFLKSL